MTQFGDELVCEHNIMAAQRPAMVVWMEMVAEWKYSPD